MSKKKRSKKRERIPVIDTLIDLAGAMTLDYLAAKRRQKNGTKRSKKIDPYAATGAAMGMGLIKDTDDIIKFGGVLGAMGAFDSDDDLPISTAAYMAPRDNRYAWRLNCEDGSAYGIDPNDYETRDEYNAAIDTVESNSFNENEDDEKIIPDDSSENVGGETSPECTPKSGSDPIGKHDPYAADDFHVYVYCLVKLDGTNMKKFYRTEDRTLKRGEAVFVPGGNSGSKLRGTICSIEHHMSFSVPKPVEETPEIIGRA